MKLFRIKKTILATVLVTLVCTSSVYAWGPGGRCFWDGSSDKRPGCGMNLTEEQQDQLAALRQQFIDDTAQTRIALNTASRNLDILLETSEPDKKAVKTLVKEITDLNATLLEKRINHQLEVKKIAPGAASGKMFRHGQKNDRRDGMRNARKTAFSSGCCGPCPLNNGQ